MGTKGIGMAKKQQKVGGDARKTKPKRKIEQYEHNDKTRVNNPPVGLVTPQTESPESPKKTYAYDPHIDPSLQWAGKAERLSFDVPTVSLHVHERIDPRTIIEAVRRKNGSGTNGNQLPLFETANENPPLRDAIDFYRHDHNWTNRLIAGDSLLVMNSLLEKEGMAGKVQMIYIDPPYGIKYGSNFQPFVNKRDVLEGKDEDLTQEPEMLKAFRDTWELGIHSYLTYLRDRLFLARDLLHESGSCFVQIGDDNVHYVRDILEEVFGRSNFVAQITFVTTSGTTGGFLAGTTDYLLLFARNKDRLKYRPMFHGKTLETAGGAYNWLELDDGSRRRMSFAERRDPSHIPHGARVFRLDNLQSQSVGREKGEGAACWFPVKFDSKEWRPDAKSRWKTNEEGMEHLLSANRIASTGTGIYYVRYIDDFAAFPITNSWTDTTTAGFASEKRYVVETNVKVAARCLVMTTDPGDLVFDPTCGSGTTAVVAEQWGRRWISCDTSRVALTLAKQRLLAQVFDYYKLSRPTEGVGGGFILKSLPHVTLKSIAHNQDIRPGMSRTAIEAATQKYAEQQFLYDQPDVDATKARISGPFTVEAVPAPTVRSIGEIDEPPAADESVARSGLTVRARDWRDELLKTGVRGRRGERIEFTRVEPLPGTRWLHADAETKESTPKRVVISFGPDHAPLEQKQVELAWEESRTLNPKPAMILFAAFQFDPEAAKDIGEMKPDKAGMVFLKVQMNTDLLTEDLKKKRRATRVSGWWASRMWMCGVSPRAKTRKSFRCR
jgi:adenine-specific DNA-methyltransferase